MKKKLSLVKLRHDEIKKQQLRSIKGGKNTTLCICVCQVSVGNKSSVKDMDLSEWTL